jgi:hypothetical protein
MSILKGEKVIMSMDDENLGVNIRLADHLFLDKLNSKQLAALVAHTSMKLLEDPRLHLLPSG